jgi:hypothetical protein
MEEGERNGRTKKGRNENKEWKYNDKGKEEIKFFLFCSFIVTFFLNGNFYEREDDQ